MVSFPSLRVKRDLYRSEGIQVRIPVIRRDSGILPAVNRVWVHGGTVPAFDRDRARVLRATEAFAAVEALVTGAVADSDVAAVGATGGVGLAGNHVGEHIGAGGRAMGRDGGTGWGNRMPGDRFDQDLGVAFLSERQFRYGPVQFFF